MCAQLTAKFFVSGTFHDIREYREHVYKVLQGHDYLTVDLSGQDERSFQVKELIDRELKASDYYVCILGHRYGSRVNDERTAPSWTHYEYEKFLERESAAAHLRMIILAPAEDSPAGAACARNAEQVYDALRLPEEERRRDRESQKFFRRLIGGGAIEPPDQGLIDLDNAFAPISLVRASRTPGAPFANTDQITIALQDFIIKEFHVWRQRNGLHPANEDAAPEMPAGPALPDRLGKLLEPRAAHPALCVVATRPGAPGRRAADVGDALVRPNFWDVDELRALDIAQTTDGSIDGILLAVAERLFGVGGDSREAIVTAIAKEVVEDGLPVSVHLHGIAEPGIAKILVRSVWPDLCKAIRARSEKDNPAGLFLVLSCEMSPAALRRFCDDPAATKRDPEKPLLIDDNALAADARAPAGGQAKEAMSG